MSKYRYKLTLQVEDHGNRTFTAEGDFDSQPDMEQMIPFDIARALLATMNSPPDSLALAGARDGDCWSQVAGLAFAHKEWDAELDFEECVDVRVDVDKLCGTSDPDHKEYIKSLLERHGIETNK